MTSYTELLKEINEELTSHQNKLKTLALEMIKLAEFEFKSNISFYSDDVYGVVGIIIGEYPFDEYEVSRVDENSVIQEYDQLKNDGGFKIKSLLHIKDNDSFHNLPIELKIIRFCLKSKIDPSRSFRSHETLLKIKNLPLPEDKLDFI